MWSVWLGADCRCSGIALVVFHLQQHLGGKGEDAVCAYIEKYGYRVIARNFICPKGEIDIIAENSDTVAFIEVKSRKENSMVSGIDSVGNTKKKRIYIMK